MLSAMADEDGGTPDPAQAFAALMSGAAQAADPGGAEPWLNADGTHKYGSHADGSPKKALGRPRKPPPVEELKAAKAASDEQAQAAGGGQDRPEDRAPARLKGKRPQAAPGEPGKPDGVPQHRPGVITKGVNRLYKRAGKIVKAMDRDIGIAIIESTKNTDDEGGDDSVGAAWEEVCRTNPRIRKFILRIIAGGAWGQLVMAHAPILMAVIMKDGIRKHIPFMKLIEALAEPDEDASDGEKAEALKPEDLGQMMDLAQGMMAKLGMGMPPAPAAGGRRAAPAPAEVT